MCIIQGPSEEWPGWPDSQLSFINPPLRTTGSLWPPPMGPHGAPPKMNIGVLEETYHRRPNSEDLQDRKKLFTVNSFLVQFVPGCTLWRTSLFLSPTENTSMLHWSPHTYHHQIHHLKRSFVKVCVQILIHQFLVSKFCLVGPYILFPGHSFFKIPY